VSSEDWRRRGVGRDVSEARSSVALEHTYYECKERDMMELTEQRKAELMGLREYLTAPRPGECLFCYVYRMLNSFGCDGTLRWAARWRDLRASRATALERRLGRRGGYCDCEIFMNGWMASTEMTSTDPETDDEVWRDPMPTCRGANLHSTEPCLLWSRRSRRW
jgi:hypothetical protein